MKIAIVEDDKESAAVSMNYIERYRKENGVRCKVALF